jgi:hypothetical protein
VTARDSIRFLLAIFVAGFLLASPWPALAQAPEPAGQMQALRDSLAFSKEQIKAYEWIETIVVQRDGEQMARIQNRVYYGADGKPQKVQLSSTQSQQSTGRTPRGIRGAIRTKVVENKKEELTEYMKAAVKTVKLYVPPDPDQIKKVREAGKVSFTPLDSGKRVRLDFRDYEKPGDTLSMEMDFANSRIAGIAVKSYIDDLSDVVTLNGRFQTLPDGVSYPARVVLDAPEKGMTVVVTNSGHRKL